MKDKLIFWIRLIILSILCLFWFIFIQVEYEIITKPELQNEFPGIKGVSAVYLVAFLLLFSGILIMILAYPILKKLKLRINKLIGHNGKGIYLKDSK